MLLELILRCLAMVFLFTYKKDIDESGKVSIKEYKLDKEGDYILSKVIPITERELEVNINNAEVI